jgi:hypothetical protein
MYMYVKQSSYLFTHTPSVSKEGKKEAWDKMNRQQNGNQRNNHTAQQPTMHACTGITYICYARVDTYSPRPANSARFDIFSQTI